MFRRAVLCLLFAAGVATAQSSVQSGEGQAFNVGRLSWMSGCWAADDGKERIEEFWMKPAGQSMIGLSRTIAAGKPVFIEYAQIGEIKGGIAYTLALGIGARSVSFKLIKGSDTEAVFENPTHDFPQRIIYRRASADSLFARIEGTEKGVAKAIDFQYKRSSCD